MNTVGSPAGERMQRRGLMQYQILDHRHIFQPLRYFPQCHASTLCMLPDRSLVCAWFAGTKEGAPDCAVWCAQFRDGVWSEPVKAADAAGMPCWNPVLLQNGRALLLFYKVGSAIPEWQTWISQSEDGGISWSPGRELVPGDVGGRGPVKNKCLRLRSGILLAPASLETEHEWICFTDRSKDGGLHWMAGAPVPLDRGEVTGLGAIQPALWQQRDGTVGMLMRSTEGVLLRSESTDEGNSWSPARRTRLPSNNSGIDLVRMDDGRLILVCNPVSGNWERRSPIAFFRSEDETGWTWSEPVLLEHVPCEKNEYRAEFSYPAVIADGKDVLITYTWKRESIAFWWLRFLD